MPSARPAAATLRPVHPAEGLAATGFELAREPLADLPRARLDLAPIAGLDAQPLGKAAFEPAQGRGIGLARRLLHELVEQQQGVVEADARQVGGGIGQDGARSVIARMINLP